MEESELATTGRLSSSLSEFGTGGNLQNIEEALRSMFIAEPGIKWAKFDGAQIQSRIVGAAEWNILGDGTYLDVCESGDLHTSVAKMTWPEFAWTGDLKKDRAIADQPLYRHHTYRDACKVLGHGTNFNGQAATLSTQTRIPLRTVEDFQRKYHRAFPAHHQWADWTDNTLRRTGTYISIDGRKRQFWARRGDPDAVRNALAYEGQSTEAYIVNNGMLNIWRARDAHMVMHEHDGLVVGYPEEREDEVIPRILEQLHFPVQLKNNRTLLIPYDCAVGWNRGAYSKDNPDGLKKYTGHDERRRSPKVGLLDRKLR
jgi:DNA polymerase I-like protein with 3'-5' exonuclease and polymerase domains